MNPRPIVSDVPRALRMRSALLLGAALIASALAVPVAVAQVQMNCVPVALPSAYPADWRSTHSLCLLTMTNNLAEPVRCDLRVQLDQTGGTGVWIGPRIERPISARKYKAPEANTHLLV